VRLRKLLAHGSIALLLVVLSIGPVATAQTVGPEQMNPCDRATFTTTVTNASATQDACLLVITRSYTEAGVLYVPGSTTITLHDATVLTDDPTADSWDLEALLGAPYSLPPGESLTVAYDLETTCAAVSGTELVTVDFEDCDDPGVPLQNVSSTSIELLPGAIVVSKIPSIQDARVGDTVTWTITVENTGLGWIKNVAITDVLGPGLAFVPPSDGGVNVGQTTTWDSGTTPALAEIAVGGTVSVELTAEVISCAGLYNDVDAAFGCGPADVCFDTAIDSGTATASLNLLVDNPALSFTPPDVTVGYCTDETAGLVQITNSGAGWARNVELCCDFAYLTVDPTRLPPDTTYTDGCFQIPDIAPGTTFDLTFYVLHPDVDWCAGGPSGPNTFQLTYTNDCDIPFVAYPQFSTLSSESGPSLNVSKSGPASLRLGETGSYDLTVEYSGSVDCGENPPGPVTIVDTYPEGFTVIDAAGGTVDAGARTITWGYDPNTDPPFAETIRLEAPTDCGYCAQPGGGSDANSITATGTDCCGCPISGTANADTTILCEGFGGVEYFSSSMVLDRDTTVRCSADYAVTVTHTYSFIDDPALDDFLLNEFTYFVDGGGDLLYSNGTATVTGASLGTVVDNTPAGRLELPLTDATSVRGQTIVYEYTLIVQDLDSPSCQASTIPIYAGVDLEAGAPDLGLCGTMYADPPAPTVTAQPPSMDVSITGIPEIQEYCATYPVTITLTRTSSDAKPYDVRLVLTNDGGSLLDFTAADCAGGTHTPTDGTACTAPIEGVDTYEWRYADLFDNDAETAQIVFDVTVPCSGPLADLSVAAFFDDLCHDDAVYDDSCSVSASDEALLALSADVYTRKSPEIVYATTRDVEWSLVVHNTGNGTAYNVWVDDGLGSGLVFDAANTSAPGATVTANQDHTGAPTNGATFLFDEVAPGELITITFAADIVSCDDLTNHLAVSWGCGGTDCQPPRTDDSIVVIPPANLVATSFSPTPVPMCSTNEADVTVKNAGIANVYNIIDTVTLPDGLVYLGNPQVQVNGGGFVATGAPAVAGQTLTWTQTETPELAEAAPNDVIVIRFDYTVYCGFGGGDLVFQATYEDPCGNPLPSNIGRFRIGLTPASVDTTLRQIDPPPGESIDCGGQATWEIDVENTGTIAIAVVQVEANLDDGLVFVSSQGDPVYGPVDGGSNTGQSVYWELEDLPVDGIATLRVTAASAGGGLDCEALDVSVDASWGCGDVDGNSATFDAECTTTSPDTASISAARRPPLDLSASVSPGSIEACDDTTRLTLTIENMASVSSAANVDVEIRLPEGLAYAGNTQAIWPGGSSVDDPTGAPGPDLTWDLSADLGPGETLTLAFDAATECTFTGPTIPITVRYSDCCGLSQYSASTSATLTVLVPALSVEKTSIPDPVTLDCYDAGDTVTWTLTVENTGNGIADWVQLTDTLGGDLVLDGSGSSAGAGLPIGGNAVGWEIGPLAPTETFTATVTAHLIQPADCGAAVRTNTAEALWGCGTFDGDPVDTTGATCEAGATVSDAAVVRIPDLAIDPSDVNPVFVCLDDGVAPGSSGVEVTVRNTGSGPIQDDFTISLAEATTGWTVNETYTGLSGTLPLAAGAETTLTIPDWPIACAEPTYDFTVTLDATDAICECNESNNEANLPYELPIPDLSLVEPDVATTCNPDGTIDVDAIVRNPRALGAVGASIRFYVNGFPEEEVFRDVAAGGTAAVSFTTDPLPCGTDHTLRLVVDEGNGICECDGTNNEVTLLVACACPALVTTKSIDDIERDGESIGSVGPVEPGDVVHYRLTTTNVAAMTTQNVDVTDRLPDTFDYVPGTTNAVWPGGGSTADPTGGVGPDLAWDLSATLLAGETLTITFDARIRSGAVENVSYTNSMAATGEDPVGTPVPPDNPDVPSDDDPDDASSVIIPANIPALSVDKRITDVIRDGVSLGSDVPVFYEDVIIYTITIRNVGNGTAYNVDFEDVLPTGLVTETDPPGGPGTWSVTAPAASGSLGLTDGASAFTTSIGAEVDGGEVLTATYAAFVTFGAPPAVPLVNVVRATGEDGDGTPIAGENASVGDVTDDDAEDPDPDDAGIASVRIGLPALVTDKRVADIVRDGASVGSEGPIREGDEIVYALEVRNVGEGTAFGVDLVDRLPAPFAYEAGTTVGNWPLRIGTYRQDPLGAPGLDLRWNTDATLRPGEAIALRFAAVVGGPVSSEETYTNVLEGLGEDGAGRPIPPNRSNEIPEDTDLDDRDEVTLAAASQEPALPFLRQTAVGPGAIACEGLQAAARLWFQTDIAMYAASEFELLPAGEEDVLPETLLPTWRRTVRTETADYALDNLLQVDALSRIGLSLQGGPRILDLASREPIYATWDDGPLGPYGEWTILDRRIVGSALGMGLVKQTIEAASLLASDDPVDRYLGYTLAEAMANKVLEIDQGLTLRPATAIGTGEGTPLPVQSIPYVPHVYEAGSRPGTLSLQDDTSHLFDQLSLLWGLARFATFVQENPTAWAPDEPGLRAYLHARSTQLINEVLTAIEVLHLGSDGVLLEVVGDGRDAPASTVSLGLLLVALDAARSVVGPFDVERIDAILAVTVETLLAREVDGRFTNAEMEADWSLARQTAAIRGLLIASAQTGGEGFETIAQLAFDRLEEVLWVDTVAHGLYAAGRDDAEDAEPTYCYTPLDVGLVVGALRELASVSATPRAERIDARLAGFVRSVVDEAALQLSNAIPINGGVNVGSGLGTLRPLEYAIEDGLLAPVLQQQLCLKAPADGEPCRGRTVLRDEPWYQTDISMYAAFVLQDRMPEIEDYADANLSSVLLHAELGIPYADRLTPDGALDTLLEEAILTPTPNLSPVTIPFAAGSPRLVEERALRWDPTTFDTRLVGSAIGMTMLRAAQEVRQLLPRTDEDSAAGRRDLLQAQLYTASILDGLTFLQEITQVGPEGIVYVPHVVRASMDTGALWRVEDPSSLLFDQLSLLYGLAETVALLADAGAAALIGTLPHPTTDWIRSVDTLLDDVLRTLETAHFDPEHRVLVDATSPGDVSWEREFVVSVELLGLTAAALEHVVEATGEDSPLGRRARALLEAEVSFLRTQLRGEDGVFCETWAGSPPKDCDPGSLLGQLGALRALLAGQRVLGVDAAEAADVYRTIDRTFWDPNLLMYAPEPWEPEAELAWCTTPLEIGLAVDAFDRVLGLLDADERRLGRDRQRRHVDRVLDALWLQLPGSTALSDDPVEDPVRYAPVFDREVCLLGDPPEEAGGPFDEVGERVEYRIVVENPTDRTFLDLVLAEAIPPGIQFVSSEPAGARVGDTLQWRFDRLEPFETLQWVLVGRWDPTSGISGPARACATLEYADDGGAPQVPLEACAEATLPD